MPRNSEHVSLSTKRDCIKVGTVTLFLLFSCATKQVLLRFRARSASSPTKSCQKHKSYSCKRPWSPNGLVQSARVNVPGARGAMRLWPYILIKKDGFAEALKVCNQNHHQKSKGFFRARSSQCCSET